ncbi:Flavohemoprotein (Hemoglobin-like protein) (Flavohemoglobin) (Nitric oxide dioxygenase) [Caballeronia glathei]|uniref:FAD-binding oxidoreductase n=1 Tax=Caballeronia glathei TaxID=60547 RepID=A0A069PDH7_9BURK|nr:pyridoxamine 5'-phosphate oxidase family protein [Caballeronia glathei]KDR38557.1 FAD-binding oxidoreductase [Caballeronia glathei]CDY73234.1 Flavohemoprotein (Hemoglobin-like protein) (Flavohemoglobin) (Nitric oxide dioxygenase) [Caballeronia glathei]
MEGSSAVLASPWHEGELTLQRSIGAVERMAGPGERQMSRNYMPEQHREFYAQLPFVVLGAVDRAGEVWATLRAGRPGFMTSPVPQRLSLRLAREAGDPADAGMEHGGGVGMLGIELHTRRRNRLNGTIHRVNDAGFEVEVMQAYGNCPQYIARRQYEFVHSIRGLVTETVELDAFARETIANADSFYVASYVERAGTRQVDASHRGGQPGFVRIDDDGSLTIPDFSGNSFFNTLGNFLINPRAGLVFVDFRNGDLLQMTGRATVLLDAPETAAFVGAERIWRFKPHRIVRREAALPLRWTDLEHGSSPNALMTGSWDDAAARMKASELSLQWRPFRLKRVIDESDEIRSFHLSPADEAGMPHAAAGQHIPIRLTPEHSTEPQIRNYTLSSAPSDAHLRISVKRDGSFSRRLHEVLKEGDIIEMRAPAGDFTVDAATRRPAVLLGVGVGVTPLIAMTRHLVHEGVRTRYQRPAWLFQAAKSKSSRAFDGELAALVQASQGKLRHVRVLSDTRGAEPGKDYDVSGRIGLDLLRQLLPFDDYDFYLCGPGQFMQEMYDGLSSMNVPDARIHAEAFGPSSLQRGKGGRRSEAPMGVPSDTPVSLVFSVSGKGARWAPGDGTLLEVAERVGLTPDFGCRSGNCGKCRATVVQGKVAYAQAPAFEPDENEALICCAFPAQGSADLQLAL